MTRWRTGPDGRTLYRGEELVGLLDNPELAAQVVAAVNATIPPAKVVPAAVLDLHAWKLQLPTGQPGKVAEVEQPALALYADEHFHAIEKESRHAVRFRAPTDGVTTGGSTYPRCELREMKGPDRASWSTAKGGHHLDIAQAITAVPRGKPHVVAGQIHDGEDDVLVVRLEGQRLIIDLRGKEAALLDGAYHLGTPFAVHFWAGGGRVKVFYRRGTVGGGEWWPDDEWWLGDAPAVTISEDIPGCYFKAGAYTQSNCDTERAAGQECGPDNCGEVEIYRLELRQT